ncbi:3-hydroxyacyl-CoA dehydrogenase NAD-binding domain-containing protein [Roseobacter sp. MH60115]|uniref:3-hydroxyacyl-CoA dehydrogenase NAD-binding domain-containing protein n=1 Tax=Roseobacter sp. MH60115 TaxID=2785324 RepID=UPI0018A2E134|nr:3-hydroxyacyl-CoA dehydrogenase NAD-binding domain-containing protein [Roseobacter sp. MH60115]
MKGGGGRDDQGAWLRGRPEKLALKQEIFAEVEEHAPESCTLTSNTSVMPITGIIGGLRLKSRALGTHWWTSPHMIPLVKVVCTEWTEDAAADDALR